MGRKRVLETEPDEIGDGARVSGSIATIEAVSTGRNRRLETEGGIAMIVCSCCETARFLHITESTMQFRDGSVRKIAERYRCVRCNGVGNYAYVEGEESVGGVVEILDDRPRMRSS